MRRNNLLLKLKGFGALAFLALTCGAPLALIWRAALIEHERRVVIMTKGSQASGTVVESGWSLRHRSCHFRYTFEVRGAMYAGGAGGCPLVDAYPVGSTIKVQYAQIDPRQSLAVGADLWPGWALVPALIALPLLLLGGVVGLAVIRGKKASKR